MSKPGQLQVLPSAPAPRAAVLQCPSRAPAFGEGQGVTLLPQLTAHTDTKPSCFMQGLVSFSFCARGLLQKQEVPVSTPNTINGETLSGLGHHRVSLGGLLVCARPTLSQHHPAHF